MVRFKDIKECCTLTVIIASLGYFVDLFDITLFGVVRVASLKDLGLTDPQQILSEGVFIYNAGMIGMMIGGVLWGVLGDKKGRLSVLFASILLYSLANIANAFVWDVNSYAACRFLCGLGLAGELGAAITLVAESLPKEKRGIGTTLVATSGMLGIVAAAFLGQKVPWKAAYVLGGVMGLCLLAARIKMHESSLFHKVTTATNVVRGNFWMLLKKERLVRYLSCIAIGVPIYFTTGILWTFAPELTAGLNVQGPVTAGNAILLGSIGLTIGDILSGIMSQGLQSRKKAVAICLAVAAAAMAMYTLSEGLTNTAVYAICFVSGLAVGYWAVLVTMAAEQFGTNLRATVATTIPNFVRGSAVFVTLAFTSIKQSMTTPQAAFLAGAFCFSLAAVGLWMSRETFHQDLNFNEE
jgi:MFS transporter, putative metabolite:H+ symporter